MPEFEKHADVEKIASIVVEVISSNSESQSTINIELDDVKDEIAYWDSSIFLLCCGCNHFL